MWRGRRRSERGAETVEFIGVLAFLLLLVGSAMRGVALARLQAVAETDARALARLAALCDPAVAPRLGDVDSAAAGGGSSAVVERGAERVVAHVTLAPAALLPLLEVVRWQPSATVVMARERGCEGG